MAVLDDLRQAIANKHAVIVAGAGTTQAAVGPGVKHASWTGLIEHGLRHAHDLGRIDDDTLQLDCAALKLKNLNKLLAAAETVADALGQLVGDGEFTAWLRNTIGALAVTDSAVPDALAELHRYGVLLATTNYDSILSDACNTRPVLVSDTAKATRLLNGKDTGILHLHGHYDQPASVVLGAKRYWEIGQQPFQQLLQPMLAAGRSLVFIGCGGTMGDPNIGHLLTVIDTVLLSTEHRHYLLCRDSEVAEWRKKEWKRIQPVGFGKAHADLPTFLTSLLPASPPPAVVTHPAPPPSVPAIPDHFVGRAHEVDTAVSALCRGEHVCVLGPGGVGKTGLTKVVAHDARLRAAIVRRVFVRLEAAQTGHDAAAKLADALGLEPGPNALTRCVNELQTAPTLLILDNAETPWEADSEGVQDLLVQCGAVARVMVSLRGIQTPQGLAWCRISLQPLQTEHAKTLFLGLAGAALGTDPLLPNLIDATAGLPLAVRLLAAQANGLLHLRDLWHEFNQEKAKLLRQGRADSRDTNFIVSVTLSLNSPRMTPPARRCLGLLGLLPDGLATAVGNAVLGADAANARRIVQQLALATEDHDRLRLLVPVRAVVADILPPEPTDRAKLLHWFLELALEGVKLGRAGGADVVRRLAPEFENGTALLDALLVTAQAEQAIDAAIALAKFQRFLGVGTTALLKNAAKRAGELEHHHQQANVFLQLGGIALYRSAHDKARGLYEAALPLYRQVGAVLGEANCILRLGDIALVRSAHDEARGLYEAALPLYQQVGDLLGEANCIKSLGDIALERSAHDEARGLYEAALPLCRQVGDLLGEANCITSLGNIALERSAHAEARDRYEAALPLYQQVGSVLGEANCIHSLGDIALEHSAHAEARDRYEAALPLYRQVGSVLGEANCIRRLGDIARQQGNNTQARSHYQLALKLYQSIPEPFSIGQTWALLAKIAETDEDRAHAYAQARAAWARLGDRGQNLIRQNLPNP